MGIRTEEKVFKKICELTGWKIHKIGKDNVYLCTNIEAPKHDEDQPAYVTINFVHWCDGKTTLNFEFSCKPCERNIASYHIGGKCPQWKVPAACDFKIGRAHV